MMPSLCPVKPKRASLVGAVQKGTASKLQQLSNLSNLVNGIQIPCQNPGHIGLYDQSLIELS